MKKNFNEIVREAAAHLPKISDVWGEYYSVKVDNGLGEYVTIVFAKFGGTWLFYGSDV